MSCSRTQHIDAGEARIRGPSVSSQALCSLIVQKNELTFYILEIALFVMMAGDLLHHHHPPLKAWISVRSVALVLEYPEIFKK